MAGYTRNDTTNQIADGNVINAAPLDGEFNAIESAFNVSTGHTHDGSTTGDGGPVSKLGPSQETVQSASTLATTTDITVATDKFIQFRDSGLKILSSADGKLDIDADTELEMVAPTVDIDASTAVTIDTATMTVTGSANVTGDLDVDNININGNAITSTDTNGNIALTPNGTGEVDISKVDIDGGAIDAVTLGTNSAVTEAQVDNINVNGNAITSTDTNGNIALTPNGTGEVDISKVDIAAGEIDGVTLGTNSAVTEAQIDNININGNAIISTDTNGNISLTPNGTGEVDISKVDIAAGEIDGVTIGTNSAVTDLRVDNIKVDGNTISSTDTNGNVTVDPNGSGQINLSANVDVTGTVTFDGGTTSADLNFGDNDKAIFGAGNDLQIYHDGTHSYVQDAGTGDLRISGNNVNIMNGAATENYIVCTNNGSVAVKHDNATKLETSSTGVDVTGNVTMTSDDPTITMTDSSGTNDIATIQATSGALIVTARDGSADGEIIFKKTDGSATDETMRIDSSGNVGIGTTSPSKVLDVRDNDATGTTTSSNRVALFATNGTGKDAHITFSNLVDSPASIGNRGALYFDYNNVERMRIDNVGGLRVGTTTKIFNQAEREKMSVKNAAVGHAATFQATDVTGGFPILYLSSTDTSTSQNAVIFQRTGGGVGSITTTASSTAYNTSSDYRLKEAVVDMTGAIDRVKALAPKRFNFIADPDTTVDGFLAHEAQTVVPEAITGTHNEVETWTQQQIDDGDAPDGTSVGDNKLDGDGNTIPVMQGIDQSKLVPLLTGALQEAIAKIETLETKVAALEAGN